ncbi:MAG: hypothetical protein ACYS32_16290 [Planctomycetota bacterium]|jgi:hypothetical protein
MSRFISKQRVVLYILFMLVLTTSCSQKLDEQIQAYQEAHNSGDVEKELSMFADNPKYEIVDQWAREGRENLRTLIETDAALNSQLIIKVLKVSKNKVTCSLEERNDWLRLAGIDPLNYEYREFIFEKGRIKEIRSKTTDEGAEALEAFRASFFEWAVNNRKEEFKVLRRQNVISKNNVGKWLDLLRAWREELEKKAEKPDSLNLPPEIIIDANLTMQR